MPTEVPLSEVPDGAVLAADVFDGHGNVLLSKGTRLTRAHAQLIERRGIRTVVVVPEAEAPAPGPEGSTPVDRQALEQILDRHAAAFSRAQGHPLAEAIGRASRTYLQAGNLPPG